MTKEKNLNLEILRIIACFLVIVNHTNSRIFLAIAPSATWFVSLAYFFVCKIAVPIFIMISGAVLLGKSESYKDVFNKRIFKIILVIIIFSLLYYINSVIVNNQRFSLKSFFHQIYINPITNAYWYLYMYLGLMVMLPIIRKMTKEFIVRDYYYCTIIWFIYFGTIPIICKYFDLNNFNANFSLTILGGSVVYFILGDFIQNKMENKYFNKKYATIAVILFAICTIISIFLTFKEYQADPKLFLFMDNTSLITIAISSISIFYLCKYYFTNINTHIKKIIIIIGQCTFGIYLLSDLLIEKLDFFYIFCIKYLHPLVSIVLLEISVFIIGFLITLGLRKVPLLKKII